MEIRGMMGESLGVIGREEPESIPRWKQDFLSTPSASIRRGIAWGTAQAYENTSTLVLTSRSLKFVDIRFPINTQNPSEAASHSSFWAFSGESSTSFYDADPSQQLQSQAIELLYTAHCKFIHDIDSRGPGIVDEGDMVILPNNDVLEFGSMLNPASGREEAYKEYWRSAQPLPKTDRGSSRSRNIGNDSRDDEKVCIVAEVASPADVAGILIRIGGRIQGIISRRNSTENATDETQTETTIQVERWTRGEVDLGMTRPVDASQSTMASKGIDIDGWCRDIRSSGHMPCACLLDTRKLGENFEQEGILWNITEV